KSENARMNVIVQFNKTASLSLDTLLSNLSAKVLRKLTNLNAHVLNLPLKAVEALANQDGVRFISPDRQTGSFGHVTTTTGTEMVRVQTTTSLLGLITSTTTFDGSGIGIAIIDSGIDTGHASLLDSNGFSRVVFSQ